MRSYTSLNIVDIESELKLRMIKIIARNIKNARLEKKLTILSASESVGLSPTFWSEMERMLKMPSSVTAVRIANTFKIPLCRILPADYCANGDNNVPDEIRKLFIEEREEKDIEKAIRLLRIYFE